MIEAEQALPMLPRAAVTDPVDTTGAAHDTLLSTRITTPVSGVVIDTQFMTLTLSESAAGKYRGVVSDEEKRDVSRMLCIAVDHTG
ncbi:hypothetical protein [Streptomyces fractus]|uniref:hypothetical protein n=1 Tax=Streptomyces fractus TaxID=641806 RepID=UPI003CEBE112